VRVVGLGECGTHAIVAARLGPWRVNERIFAKELIADFEPNTLVIADEDFTAIDCGKRRLIQGRICCGICPNLPVVRALVDGSYEGSSNLSGDGSFPAASGGRAA
jgi:hypothetical protein